MLSCACDSDDGDGWRYFSPTDFSTLNTKRAKRCVSCGCRLAPGSEVLAFERNRPPANDIEERIYVDEVPLATWYMCETCGGLYLAITEAGYCVLLAQGENMRDLAHQAHADAEYARQS